MDGNLAMANPIVNETEKGNNFQADVYYHMEKTGCSKEQAIEAVSPLYWQ